MHRQQQEEVFQQESRQLLQERERMDQQQQMQFEQYQREESLRRERARKQQQDLFANQRREEEEIRMRQERERRQILLRQQELQQQQQISVQTNLEQQRETYRRQQAGRLQMGAQSGMYESAPQISPGGTSWKRTYIVEPKDDVIKNEIKISDDLLQEESYYIDLLARRDTFIERPRPPPSIQRLGKVWEPPPDKPYHLDQRRPHREFVPIDDKEHKWEPYVLEPEFKYERKNFTPEPSPPPRRRSMRQAPTPMPSLAQNPSIPLPPLQIRDHTPIPLRPPFQGQPRIDPGLDVKMRVIQRPPSVTPSETSSFSAMYASEPNLPQRVSPQLSKINY